MKCICIRTYVVFKSGDICELNLSPFINVENSYGDIISFENMELFSKYFKRIPND